VERQLTTINPRTDAQRENVAAIQSYYDHLVQMMRLLSEASGVPLREDELRETEEPS